MPTAPPSVPSSGSSALQVIDQLIHDAQNAAGLIEAILATFVPSTAAFDAEITAILSAIASVFDKLSGASGSTPSGGPTP